MKWVRELGAHLALLSSTARRLVVAAWGAWCPRAPGPPEAVGAIQFRHRGDVLRFDDLTEIVAFQSRTDRLVYQPEVN